MEEKVLTTPTGVDLFKNANGILPSSDMEELKSILHWKLVLKTTSMPSMPKIY